MEKLAKNPAGKSVEKMRTSFHNSNICSVFKTTGVEKFGFPLYFTRDFPNVLHWQNKSFTPVCKKVLHIFHIAYYYNYYLIK